MRMQQQPSTLVLATSASALVFGGDTEPPVSAYDANDEAGEQAVHLPSLVAPRSKAVPAYDLSGDNCVLRWARIPAKYSGPVDVVIHFHGYWRYPERKDGTKDERPGKLATLAARSGIDLRTPGVGRPTVGLVPHGVPRQWFEDGARVGDGFTFPQLATKAQLETVIDEALQRLGKLRGGDLSRGRLVLTCHSGGGAAVVELLKVLKDYRPLCGCQFFDASYGGTATATVIDGWAAQAIDRDAKALAALAGDDARRRYLQATAAHLRMVFIENTGTAKAAIDADALLRDRLAAVKPAEVGTLLRKHFRAQKVADTKKVWHGRVPVACGGRLLADPGNDLAPDALDLPAPVPARAKSYEAWDEDVIDAESAAALDWESEAQDVTMPQKKVTRPADAPTGSAFIASLGDKKGVERENRIFEQLKAGNIPSALLTFHTVRLTGKDKSGASHEFEYYVTPDVLSVGSDSDSVRVPMDPVTAQRVADFFECLLPTARMVEQVYQAAPAKLAFIYGNYAGTSRKNLQTASGEYLWHSRKIDEQLRRPPTILTAGHKKEVVISSNYIQLVKDDATGQRVPKATLAYYGAHDAAGVPIQAGQVEQNGKKVKVRGLTSFAHDPAFADYSHGVRLVWPTMKVDGANRKVADVLKDPQLWPLIVKEGPIPNPRYTLDRNGKPVTAKSQALASDDPLALGSWDVGALGYGSTWDPRIRSTVEGFLAGWKAIPVTVGGQAVTVHPPYFINVNDKSAAASKERMRLAEQHRAAAPAALRALINEKRFLHARIGKATTEKLRELLEAADAQGVLRTDATVGGQATPDNLRAFLKHYGLGVDCSGFVALALNQLVALFKDATAADRIAEPLETSSAMLKGGQGAFERVTDPTQLCGGDTMWLQGHIRILAFAERKGDRIVFCTAESRASDPKDIGPSAALWRLVPDAKAGTANFKGWRLERSKDLGATDSNWQAVNTTHVYGHYKPLRKLLKAAGVTPAALAADDEAWALQAPQRYLPTGGRNFVPRQGTFNTAPAAFTVVPASFLPEPTTDTTGAINSALTAAGLTATQRGQIARPGLVPIAAAFGASALGELFARLRWAPDFIVTNGDGANDMLVQRLLIHIPGHFRELARRAPSAVEAFVLECLGWAMMSHVRHAIENATRTRWWIPPAPDFVTAVPNPMPAVSAEVRNVITRIGFIDTVMPVGDWNARYASWRRGLAGRQWDSEVNGTTPGLPLYAGLLTVPAHVSTATQRAAFTTAWNRRVAAVDAMHAPIAAGAARLTLAGLRNALELRQDAPGHIPAGTQGGLDLQGLELARGTFPLVDGGPVSTRFTLLRQIHPVCTALFRAIRELGWNDLIYQNSGAVAFRGIKHSPRAVAAPGNPPIPSPWGAAPTQALVDQINNTATAASRTAVINAVRTARSMSDHAMAIAIDVNYPENVDNVAARPFGSMDPRLVALFEAFHFRWGAGFSPTDPHHFDYSQNPSAPAAVAGQPAPAAGALPGMIPNFPAPGSKGKGGTAVA